MPMVLLSATGGSMSSPNSLDASRPRRNSAPVRGARTLSPEQSAKTAALIVCHVSVVVCQPLMETMRSPSISAWLQEQLRKSWRFSVKRAVS